MTRRELLMAAAQAAAVRTAFGQDDAASAAAIVRAYESQGIHRTGTQVDIASGLWLMREVERAGLKPERENFSFERVEPVAGTLTIRDRRFDGLPLFDAAFTDAAGVSGLLGPLGSEAPIGFVEAAPNTAGAGPLGVVRRRNQHRAIVVVTKGGKPGLCPNNADDFPEPFGPPVLQISSEYREALAPGVEVRVVAEAKRVAASTFNVTARIAGSDPKLAPLIVMTPRSGWWTCASERGGGIVCWLALMRALRGSKPARDVLFVASTGHEIGYRGIEVFIANRPDIVKRAHGWIHFGANIGAAQGPGITVQASDDEMEAVETQAIEKAGFRIDRRVPRGTVPGGEAGSVHKRGGRYLSLIGQNTLFHNQLDRGPEAIDAGAINRFGEAFSGVAKKLAEAV